MGIWGRATERLTLVPIFGCRAFGANTTCADIHRGPIPDDDRVCCMVCFGTGVAGHPDLKETATDKVRLKGWEPEAGQDQWGRATEATAYEPPAESARSEPTRRQKRAARYGNRSVAAESMDPDRLHRAIDAMSATIMA